MLCFTHYRCHKARRTDNILAYLATILLMHDTELNPGPSDNSEFPCGSCDALVDWVDKGVMCDTCQQWFHAGCQQICTVTYDDLGNSDASWHCAACGMRNIAPSLFMSTMTATDTVVDFWICVLITRSPTSHVVPITTQTQKTNQQKNITALTKYEL